MNPVFRTFLLQLIIFTAITGAVALGLVFVLPPRMVSPALPWLFPLFTVTSLLSFRYLLLAADKRFIRFVNTFLLTIIFKLFLFAGVMIVYVFMNRMDAVPFMLSFFSLYLAFTVFETVAIIRHTTPPRGDH